MAPTGVQLVSKNINKTIKYVSDDWYILYTFFVLTVKFVLTSALQFLSSSLTHFQILNLLFSYLNR